MNILPKNVRSKTKQQSNKLNDNEVSPEFSQSKIDENFAVDFQKAMMYNPLFFNPIWQNEILKDINMHPMEYDRDRVEQLLKNPRDNEVALRQLSQYLDGFIMQFKRVLDHFSKILTFDYIYFPTNADEEDMKKTTFKTSEAKVIDFLQKINMKQQFGEIMKGVMLEDAKYYYVRQSESGMTLQEMPSQYCKIYKKNDMGYQYAFDLTYFLRPGVDFNDFAPEFYDYFVSFINGEDYKRNKADYDVDRYFYWQKLDPTKAFVFKFNDTVGGVIPPLAGLFVDTIEIATYKQLLKTKTKLETWKLLINKIPMHTDSKNGSSKNNFAVDADLAATFTKMMQDRLPNGVSAVTVPFEETEVVDFSQAQTKDSVVGIGQQNFFDSSGAAPSLFGAHNTNGTGLQASITTDANFVIHMYRQFERFINLQLKLISGRYRFKVVFPDITSFNYKEKQEMFLKAAQYGYSKMLVGASQGINPSDYVNLLKYEKYLDYSSFMIPLQSSHVQAQDGGRPTKSSGEIGDAGQKQRDLDANANR